MNKSFKFPQLLLTIMSALGMFLPLVTVRDSGLSESISFFNADTDGKIIFGLIVVAAILLLFKNEKNNVLGIVALLFITGAGIYFWVDMSKIADGVAYVKIFSGDVIHYGIGYYMTLIGLILSFIIGLLDLITSSRSYHDSYNDAISELIRDIPQPMSTNQNSLKPQYIIPTNTVLNQTGNVENNVVSNQNDVVNNQNIEPNTNSSDSVKLSDLVNGSSNNLDNNKENDVINNNQ